MLKYLRGLSAQTYSLQCCILGGFAWLLKWCLRRKIEGA